MPNFSTCQYCDKPSRINYTNIDICWNCYHDILKKMNKIDWRDEHCDKKMIDFGFLQRANESKANLANRCKAYVMKNHGKIA